MKALRKATPGFGLVVAEVAEPSPGPDEVLVEVHAAGICGSDLHVYEWTPSYEWMAPLMPVTLGHEFSGTVVARGPGVEAPAEGMRVTVWPSYAGGTCAYCRAGIKEHCACRKTVGLRQDGGFARFVRVPAKQCITLPEGLDFDIAALSEPLAVGANAVHVSGLGPGENVVILGPGPIGLAVLRFAKLAGCSDVTVMGFDDEVRLTLASQLGADRTFDLARTPVEAVTQVILETTNGIGVSHVFEATGIASSINNALAMVRWGGVVTAVGIHGAPLSLPLTDFVRQRKQLRGSHGSTRSAWDWVMESFLYQQEELHPLITHRFAIEEGIEGFEAARSRGSGKVLLKP